MYVCKLCEKAFEELPDGAVLLSGSRRSSKLYRFPDGSFHELQDDRFHRRWHVNRGISNYPGCKFCEKENQQVTTDESAKTEVSVSQKETVSQPIGSGEDNHPPGGGTVVETLHKKSEVTEPKPATVMAHAFAKLFSNQNEDDEDWRNDSIGNF